MLTKCLAVILLFIVCPITGAQNLKAVEDHGLVVLKYEWTSYRPGWDRRLTGGMGPVRDSTGQINPPVLAKGSPPTRLGYLYKTRFANHGQKETRAVVWEYRFINKATGESIAHRFRSVLKLKPRASREVKQFSYEQPSAVTDINTAGKTQKEAFEEEVRIVRVEYRDGSTWVAQ